MPEFPGRLRTPRLPSAPGTPAVGEIYYNTANNTLYWWNGSAWVTAGTPRVAALPGSPVDGQECYYVADATNAVLWHLRYNAGSASAYKWEFLGGAELGARVDTFETTTSGTYVDLTTVGPSITVPLAGEYRIVVGATAQSTAAGVFTMYMGYAVGATAPVSGDELSWSATASGAGGSLRSPPRRKTIAAAATAVIAKYASSFTAIAQFGMRWMEIRPVRVG